jgi:cation diffusion facilitator family transporter
MSRKRNIALLSVGSNSLLVILKIIVGFITGSVSIISEAIHSLMDLVASMIAFFSVRISDKPADERHPYGHEKMENVSGVVEGGLIVLASGWIIYESIKKLMSDEPVTSVGLGFVVMFISAIVNFLVSRKLYQVAREEDSMALEADALHLKADVYTSLGVGVGLLLIWLTGLNFLDPIVAIGVALFILKEAFGLIMSAFHPLLDHKLSDEEEHQIKTAIKKFKNDYIEYHDFRTRKAGKIRHIDFHLTLHRNITLEEAHKICDNIEREIEANLKHTKILIHPETCSNDCDCSA